MATKFKLDLGSEVKDLITDFSGIVMTQTHHLTGCNTYGVSPKVLAPDGKPAETQWFDEPRLVKIGDGVKMDYVEPGAGDNQPIHHNRKA